MKRIVNFLLALAILAGVTACSGPAGTQSEPQKPTWQEQYDLGVRYLSEGNYEEAIIAFTAAIEIDPKQAPAYVGRGDAYVRSGETEDNLAAAKVDYETAIELDETNVEAYLGLADVYIRRGDYDKALEILKWGLEKVGESQEISSKIDELNTGNISDSSGKTRRMTSYDGSGALRYWHDYTYNDQGQRDSVTSFNAVGNQTGHVNITYNKAGEELIGYWYMGETGEVGREERAYNDSGNIASAVHYNLDGSMGHTTTYTYNSAGQMIRSDTIYSHGGCDYDLYEYDGLGNQVKRSMYGGDGQLGAYELSTYNENGKMSGSQWYDGRGELQWYYVYCYDEQGKATGYNHYDAAGNLIGSFTYN